VNDGRSRAFKEPVTDVKDGLQRAEKVMFKVVEDKLKKLIIKALK